MAVDEATIRDDMKAAMRAKDALRTRVIRTLLAAIKNKAIESRVDVLPERDVVAVIQREVKQCRETLDFARKAGRTESVAEHEAELTVLEGYLPEQLGEADLRSAVETIVSETGATSIGPVMKLLGERHGGRYDGKVASRIVKEVLG
jgi:uncharacterized protein YqeY